MWDLIELKSNSVRIALNILLKDRSTGKNITFASNTYNGMDFASEITKKLIDGDKVIFRPRVAKSQKEQVKRTRKKAEVFTPSWICNMMNNQCDQEWFGRDDVFNSEQNKQWETVEKRIVFPVGKTWKDYVLARRLEITCGEGPYLVSRYDTVTGEMIPLSQRIGILDRKLRVINENVKAHRTWNQWVYRAFESTYGYEYQGDNLLMARINLLETFCEYSRARWESEPSQESIKRIARIISWNIWQMDGLLGTLPRQKPQEIEEKEIGQLQLFTPEEVFESTLTTPAYSCQVRDWQREKGKQKIVWKRDKDMKFDFVIGNPPYQDNTIGDNETYAPPVYDKFMDAAYEVGDKVELIHPARFLFNAGSTSKTWNKKILNDEHFKVKLYEQDSSKIFPNTDIKGGLVISYRNKQKVYGAIEIFTPDEHLNAILQKVKHNTSYKSISDIVITRTAYRLTPKLHKDYPDAINQLSKGHAFDMSSNIFERLPQVFSETRPDDGNEYISILGRQDNQRIYKFIRKDYVKSSINTDFYKVVIPQASGKGEFGERISQPCIGCPGEGTTETFITIGCFETEREAENCKNYISTKMCRTMLGILKRTQALSPDKWKYIPIQDFTPSSDIDWSQSIADIDKQLYKKYNLTPEEIDFIETHVKEME